MPCFVHDSSCHLQHNSEDCNSIYVRCKGINTKKSIPDNSNKCHITGINLENYVTLENILLTCSSIGWDNSLFFLMTELKSPFV